MRAKAAHERRMMDQEFALRIADRRQPQVTLRLDTCEVTVDADEVAKWEEIGFSRDEHEQKITEERRNDYAEERVINELGCGSPWSTKL